MQKYHKKHDNVHYINKNHVLKPIYNDENECINDTLSLLLLKCITTKIILHKKNKVTLAAIISQESQMYPPLLSLL